MAKKRPYANINALWGAMGVRVLERLGLSHVVISPGSRSTPLAYAFAESKKIKSTVVLDERSAGFIALGIAKATRRPVALLCTSGTAVANYLPAVIEARLSATPLIVLSADRPPELRDCHSGQTITQPGIFSQYPVWSTEVAVPSVSLLNYWRQVLVDAWQRSQGPLPGPVHLNLPFRDPLSPQEPEKGFKVPAGFNEVRFTSLPPSGQVHAVVTPSAVARLLPSTKRGVIVVGPHVFPDRSESTRALLELSAITGWPILADGAGTLRGDGAKSGRIIHTYDMILRQPLWARKCRPEVAVIVGPLPTSKVLRTWMKDSEVMALQIQRAGENTDATHARWTRCDAQLIPSGKKVSATLSPWIKQWQVAQKMAQKKIDRVLQVDWPFEGALIPLLNEALSESDRLFVGSSMPIRDCEWFYHPAGPGPEILCNRGANGIDGTVSTALGASLDGKHTVLLCGDLTFLHDSNALLSAHQHSGDLTMVVVNNHGGGIFNHLAIAEKNPHFEKIWATPQNVRINQLCAAHGIRHQSAENFAELRKFLEVRGRGVRVIEFWTNREKDARHRRQGFRA